MLACEFTEKITTTFVSYTRLSATLMRPALPVVRRTLARSMQAIKQHLLMMHLCTAPHSMPKLYQGSRLLTQCTSLLQA